MSARTPRPVAAARPKPGTGQGDLTEYRPNDDGSAILVLQRRKAAAAIVRCLQPPRRLPENQRRLCCRWQLPTLLQGKPQLIQILVRPIENGNLYGLAWR